MAASRVRFGRDVRSGAIYMAARLVLVVMPYPVRQAEVGSVFHAALRSQVYVHVGAEYFFIAASV